jgi:hypothetical protein
MHTFFCPQSPLTRKNVSLERHCHPAIPPGAPSFRSIIAEGWDTSNSKARTAMMLWDG